MLSAAAPSSAGRAYVRTARLIAAVLTDISDSFRLAERDIAPLARVALDGATAARLGFYPYDARCWVALSAAVTLFHG
jgi:hypothetical protein